MKALTNNRKNKMVFILWVLLLIIMPHCCYAITGAYDNVSELLKARVYVDSVHNSKVKYKSFSLDRSDIPALIKELKNNNPNICAEAARLLSGSTLKYKRGGMEDDIIAALRDNLEESDSHLVQQSAAVSLVKIDYSLSKEMMPFLIEAVKEETHVYWSDALLIFERMGPDAEDSVPVIIEALKRQQGISRILYYSTLASIGTPEALEASKGYTKKWEFLGEHFDTQSDFVTKPFPNIIVALAFICLFWWSRRLSRVRKQMIYLPLLIPIFAWSISVIWAILYNYNPLKGLFITDAPPPLFLIFHTKYSTLVPGFLTLATLAGIIPWLISLWRWKKRAETNAN